MPDFREMIQSLRESEMERRSVLLDGAAGGTNA
jgi:hypothetical protein